jgi:hypothetical protein
MLRVSLRGFPKLRWTGAGGAAVFTAALAACFFGDASLTGRGCPCVSGWVCSGSATPATPAGICVPANDGPSGDAQPDATARDGGPDAVGRDTGMTDHEGGVLGDSEAGDADAGAHFCELDAQRTLLLCADFDEDNLRTFGGFQNEKWTAPQSEASIDDDASVSPPSSARFSMEASDAEAGAPIAYLYQTFSRTFMTASFQGDVRLDAIDGNGGRAQLVSLIMGYGTAPGSSVAVDFDSLTGWSIEEAYPTGDHNTPIGVPMTSDWTHVDLEIALDVSDGGPGGGMWTVTLTDLATHSSKTQMGALVYAGARPKPTEVSIGLSYDSAHETGWGVHFDNVTFQLE